MDDKKFLNDIDRGDYDASKGYPHKEMPVKAIRIKRVSPKRMIWVMRSDT
jgi:hypothetical protein